mgnify:CR=1 FL=1
MSYSVSYARTLSEAERKHAETSRKVNEYGGWSTKIIRAGPYNKPSKEKRYYWYWD